MSKCNQVLAALTKRDRNSAQVIEPANPPDDTLLVSATFESSMLR